MKALAAAGFAGLRRVKAQSPLDLGTIGTADGLSQFSSDYNVSYVIQNGARSAS
jgi:hypothetical protein